MDAKYTPGPWMKSTHGGISKYSIWSSSGQHIADTNTTKSIGFERCAANASLIAAAPDLLEALRKYELPIDINNIALSCIEFGSIAVERELQRRAAIAKATGEPQ